MPYKKEMVKCALYYFVFVMITSHYNVQGVVSSGINDGNQRILGVVISGIS